MANTFTQLYIQVVFAVQNRFALIDPSWEDELYKYITGVVQAKDQKMIAVNGMPDHIHLFIGMKPTCNLADLIREIKKSTNGFINDKQFIHYKFGWQEGYGAFSYSHNQIDNVVQYINRQKEHHHKKTFKEEYIDFLKTNEINFKEEYLFEWFE